MSETIKAYKGFNKDMTCTPPNTDIRFQYEEGKEYKTDKLEACKCGFHACEYPLDCFGYYAPSESVYCEVEQRGELSHSNDDSKASSTKIKIGASINIAGMVKAAIEYTTKRIKKENDSNEDYGASSATGYKGASIATGDYGASSATGDYGASSATGYKGASSATGDYGASSATGNCGVSSATGYKGASSATGDYGASSATGNCGVSSATGYKGASIAGEKESIAVAWGYKSKAKGVLGSYLVFADWEGDEDRYWVQSCWTLKGAKMVQVDGETIKENTFYTMENGELTEVE